MKLIQIVGSLALLTLSANAVSAMACHLDEKTGTWHWRPTEASATDNGTVVVSFERCPGRLAIRLVQDDEVVFRAESEEPFLSGEVIFRAGAPPVPSPGLVVTYPLWPEDLEPGRYMFHLASRGIEASKLVVVPDPNKLATVDVGKDDVHLYLGPRFVSEMTLRFSDGTVVWSHSLVEPVSCVRLRLKGGLNDLTLRFGCDGETGELALGRFELEASRFHELEAVGPDGTYAAYFRVP